MALMYTLKNDMEQELEKNKCQLIAILNMIQKAISSF